LSYFVDLQAAKTTLDWPGYNYWHFAE